jgi:hypothetical protein
MSVGCIGPSERGSGLRQSRFEQAEVANAGSPARRREQPSVQFDDLTEREVPHQAKRR